MYAFHRKRPVIFAIALGLGGAATAPGPAAARIASSPVPRNAPPPGVVVPFLAVPQPKNVPCAAVKINASGTGYYGVMNCQNSLAYVFHSPAKPPAVPGVIGLAAPPGPGAFLSERVYDVDEFGNSIGETTYNTPAGAFPFATAWNAAGVGALVLGKPSIAYGLNEFGTPGPVGSIVPPVAPVVSAFWFAPALAGAIAPAPASASTGYDVNTNSVIAGQLNGTAAIGIGHFGPLAPIPGIAPVGIAYAIDNGGQVAGREDNLPAKCGASAQSDGFLFSPIPLIVRTNPIAPYCRVGWEDLNEFASVVGFEARAVGRPEAAGVFDPAVGECKPFPPGITVDINTIVAGHHWHWLTDAPGIDDTCDIIATDGGAPISQVYVIN